MLIVRANNHSPLHFVAGASLDFDVFRDSLLKQPDARKGIFFEPSAKPVWITSLSTPGFFIHIEASIKHYEAISPNFKRRRGIRLLHRGFAQHSTGAGRKYRDKL
jgi:hypothetical protein